MSKDQLLAQPGVPVEPITDSRPARARIPAWRIAAVVAASAAALAACAKGEEPLAAPPDGGQGGGIGVEEPGQSPESMESPPECPTITPEFKDGSLTAHATAPDTDEFSTNHYFGLMTDINDPRPGHNIRTAWYAPFNPDGTADITIPSGVMEEIYSNGGSGITSLSVWSDVKPPAESLTPEGMPNSGGIADLLNEAVEEKGIDPTDTDELAARQDELPRYTTCSVAEWDVNADGAGSWFTASEQGLVPADNPFAPQEQNGQTSGADETSGENPQPEQEGTETSQNTEEVPALGQLSENQLRDELGNLNTSDYSFGYSGSVDTGGVTSIEATIHINEDDFANINEYYHELDRRCMEARNAFLESSIPDMVPFNCVVG